MKKTFFGVVASIRPTSLAELKNLLAIIRKYNVTSIEIRLDGLPYGELQQVLNVLAKLMLFAGKPFILTLRSKEQGGEKVISPPEQFDFWATLPSELHFMLSEVRSSYYVDWGLDLHQHCQQINRQLFPWSKVGASLHDPDGTPEDLRGMLAKLEATLAQAFLKLVTTAKSQDDVALVKAIHVSRTDPRPLIAFPMGEKGEQGRRDCLGWGSIATYGYVPGCPKTAPGQLSIDELLVCAEVRRALKEHNGKFS